MIRRLSLLTFITTISLHAAGDRVADWREDLHFLSAGLSESGYKVDFTAGIATRGQKDFAKLYPSFATEIASIEAAISKLSDPEIVFRLMRLIASARVAHNYVGVPNNMGFFRRLPLTMVWYPDGLGVVGAAAEYRDAIGARVLTMGGKTPDELLEAARPYISHEDDSWLRLLAPGFIVRLSALQHFGLAGADGRVVFRLAKPGAAPFTMSVAVGDPRDTQITLAEALHLPASLLHDSTYYAHQYLEDSQTLYVQYNRCQNDPRQPFSDFAREAMAEAGSRPVKNVVVDLRENSGGDSRVIDPLKSALSHLKKPVYVLMGPKTFSSGLLNARMLKMDLHATLVGAPSGERLNSYGEVKILTLPHSKLWVQYTTKYFRMMQDSDFPLLEPDLPAPATFADALAGRDGALEAAIHR